MAVAGVAVAGVAVAGVAVVAVVGWPLTEFIMVHQGPCNPWPMPVKPAASTGEMATDKTVALASVAVTTTKQNKKQQKQ